MKTIEEYNLKYGWKIPINCPVCNHPLAINESGQVVCINNCCPRKLSHQFSKTFEVLGIKGAGDAFIDNMEKVGITYSDFFELVDNNEADCFNKYAGGINGEKILIQMKKVLAEPITIPKFLACFDYKGFDEKKLKVLANYSLDEIYNLDFDDLMKFDGFAEKTANLFLQFMNDKQEEIEDIRQYFTFKTLEKNNGKLNGMSFCFTGAACKPRKELQELVEKNGGTNKSGVSKGLTYLVTDDVNSGSSKNKKAAELNIKIISSTDFLNLIK